MSAEFFTVAPNEFEHIRAQGLTKHSYEAISLVLAEAAQQQERWRELFVQITAIVAPYLENGVLPRRYTATPIGALYRTLNYQVPVEYTFGKGNRGGALREYYPLSTWRKNNAGYRSVIKNMERALKMYAILEERSTKT